MGTGDTVESVFTKDGLKGRYKESQWLNPNGIAGLGFLCYEGIPQMLAAILKRLGQGWQDASRVKVLAANPNPIPRTHIVEGENQLLQVAV